MDYGCTAWWERLVVRWKRVMLLSERGMVNGCERVIYMLTAWWEVGLCCCVGERGEHVLGGTTGWENKVDFEVGDGCSAGWNYFREREVDYDVGEGYAG